MTRRTTYKPKAGPSGKILVIVAIIGAIATIVAAIVGVWPFDKTTPTPPPIPTSVVPPEAKFRSIEDGDSIVGTLDSAHGTYDRVSEDKEIWIVAWRGTTCYPMDGPAVKEETHVWRHGPLEFLDGGQYSLSTVLADESASARLRMAVGKSTGLPCLPDGAEFIETISVEVRTDISTSIPTTTPEPIATPTPPATPIPTGFLAEGKVCEISEGDDTNTIYLRQTEFTNLGLPRRAKVNVHVTDTEREARNVTLEIDLDLAVCVVKLSLALRTSLGIPDDTVPSPEQRPDRRFAILESPIEIEITSLKDGNPVGPDVPSVLGTYADIPSDRKLWLVVHTANNFWPQPGPATLKPGNVWTCGPIYFGGVGDYELLAVLVDEEASLEFRERLDGSPIYNELPVGAIIYDSVAVTREQ